MDAKADIKQRKDIIVADILQKVGQATFDLNGFATFIASDLSDAEKIYAASPEILEALKDLSLRMAFLEDETHLKIRLRLVDGL